MRKVIFFSWFVFAMIFSVMAVARETGGDAVYTEYAESSGEIPFEVEIQSISKASISDNKVLTKATLRQDESDVMKLASIRKIASVNANLDDYLGEKSLFSHSYPYRSSLYGTSNITKVKDDSVKISRFFYTDVEIKAFVNVGTGIVEIPSQFIQELEGVGKITLCRMDLRKAIYDETSPITGHLYNGAVLIDDSFGFIVTEGEAQGAYLNIGLQEYTAFATPNVSITANRITYADNTLLVQNRQLTEQKTGGYVYPVGNDKVRLMHLPMGTGYSDLVLNLNSNGKVTIDPQPVYYSSYSGDFCIYNLTETVSGSDVKFSISLLNPIEANYSESTKTLNWGKWAVASTTANSLVYTYDSTKVELTEELVFPSILPYDLVGDGSKENPYQLNTAADFMKLRSGVENNVDARGEAVNYGDATESKTYIPVYGGKYFSVGADIDFSEVKETVKPIGTDVYFFDGILDGNNKTLSNFTIENYAYDYSGLFARTGYNAEIRNIKFKDAYVSTLGYIAGVVAGRSYGKISKVEILDSRVISNYGYHTGLLAGYSNNLVDSVTVKNGYVLSLGYVGGLVGRSYSDLKDCHVEARVVMGGKQVFGGGIVGHQSKVAIGDPEPVISGCSYSGMVTASGNEIGIGGIAGALSYSRLESSFANAVVYNASSISSYVGGLVGTTYQSRLTDCYASGFVRNSETQHAGGLVGHNTTSTTEVVPTVLTNCYSSAMLLTKSTEPTRGLVGSVKDFTIKNCFFDNQISVVPDGEYGKSTAELTSSKGIEGFSGDKWIFTDGVYPSLKGNNESDAAIVSTAALHLADGETIAAVEKDFQYKSNGIVDWYAIVNGEKDTTGGYAFSFKDGVGKLNYEQYTDTIYVAKGSVAKYYFVNIAPVLFSGSGSAEEPWLIKSGEDLKKLSQITNNATMPFIGKYFELCNDIDLAGDTIVPICKDAAGKFAFEGIFDGKGYAIHNMNVCAVGFFNENNLTGTAVIGQVNPKDEASYNYSGLFGNIGKAGVVKNLTVSSDCRIEGFSYVGSIAGSSVGLVENCYNYAPVTAYYSTAGGIVGYLKEKGRVKGCYNNGYVRTNANTVGGIVGNSLSATVEACENTGNVSACWFNPYQKEAAQYGAGGIVGTCDKSSIVNVVNSGTVTSYKQVGGIASKVTGTAAAPALIENALNYGLVDAWNEKITLGSIAGDNTLGTFRNNFVDKQLQKVGLVANNKSEGIARMTVAELTSGTVSLPDSVWTVKEGAYPTMKYSQLPMQVALNSQAVVKFDEKDFASSMTATATLAANIEWSLVNNALFSITDAKLNVMIPMAGCFTDTLVAKGFGCERRVPVGTLNPTLTDGEGTLDNPYKIREATEFLAVARFMKQWKFDYEGYNFKVENDLDFKDFEFVPFGADGVSFNGKFDGGLKTLKNISFKGQAADKTAVGYGVFGTVGPDGLVSNLILDNTVEIGSYSEAGGVVGYLYGAVENCENRGSVSTLTGMNAGGIAGKAYKGARLAGNVNSGNIVAKTSYAGGIVGSAAAASNLEITDCSNNGKVTGTTKIGGIVGSASAYIQNCVNTGAVTATGTYAAGVVAEALLPSGVKDCNNEGDVSSPQYGGGIVGTSTAHTTSAPFVVENCHNAMDLKAGAKGYMGGVVCTPKAGVIIKSCSNKGAITGSTTTTGGIRMGGIAADISSSASAKSAILDCYNTGKITSYSNSAGIVGYITGDSTHVERCYNLGDVYGGYTTAVNVGGIAGNGSAEFVDCWNAGNIEGAGKQVGGIEGTNTCKSLLFLRNFNIGNVKSGTTDAGGLIGLGRATMVECYNFGTVTATNNVGGLIGTPGAAANAIYTVRVYDSYNAGKLSASGANVGNIMSNNTSCKFIDVNNIFADADVNTEKTYDKTLNVKMLPTARLVEQVISDGFENNIGSYPALKVANENEMHNFHIATLIPAEGESLDNIASDFVIGTPKGADWTGTPNLEITGNIVSPKATVVGETATLTLKAGGKERTYSLVLTKVGSGVGSLDSTGKQIKNVYYYRLDGTEAAAGEGNKEIVVERIVYVDGTEKIHKVVK